MRLMAGIIRLRGGVGRSELFGEDTSYDHLEDVMKEYRKQFNLPVPPRRSDPTPEGLDRGA